MNIDITQGQSTVIEVAVPTRIRVDIFDRYAFRGDDAIFQIADKNFIFTQDVSSDVWTINHNLNKYAAVTVVDSANSVVIGVVDYIDKNTIKISFGSSFSGTAYLN